MEIFGGCRTYNGIDANADESVNPQTKDGRGNLAPVTIIIPKLAMLAAQKFNCKPKKCTEKAIEHFFELLNEKLEEARDSLIERFDLFCEQDPKAGRFLYENNLLLGYDGKTCFSALKHGTLALGKIGIAETLQILIGKDHTTEEGMELAKRIEKTFNIRCAEFKKALYSNENHPEFGEYHLNFGNYNTPRMCGWRIGDYA